jgi:hypothetical protein
MPYFYHLPLFAALPRRLLFLFTCALVWAPAYACEPCATRHSTPAPADYPTLAATLHHDLSRITAPAPALTALAHKLTAGRVDPRERALALSDWVRKHIRHVELDTRPGVAKRRTAEAVLESGHGDGPDVALLLQALLVANGIDATLALVQRGPDYGVPNPPTLDEFDVVLVYVPELGLYLAPDERDIAAGYLPQMLLGKPALLVHSGSFGMTPLSQPDSVRSIVSVDLRHAGDAGIRLERTYSGAGAEFVRTAMREVARNASPAERAQMAPLFLEHIGKHGHGTLTTGMLEGGGDFRMTLSGTAQDVMLPGAPSLATSYARLGMTDSALAGLRELASDIRIPYCPRIDLEDELRYQLPSEQHVVALPAAVNVVHGGLFYRADYERQADAVLVKRRLTFRSGRPTCSAADVKDMQPALVRIERDLHSRITVAGP